MSLPEAAKTACMTDRDVARWRSYALSCALGFGLKGESVEDAAQEALVRLYEAWSRPTGDPHGYYAATVRNAVLNYLEHERAKRHAPLRDGISDDCEDDGDTPREQRNDRLAYDPYSAVDDALDAIDRLRELAPYTASLTPYERDVLKGYMRGDSRAEIAEALRRTPNAIKRTRIRIKDKLGTYGAFGRCVPLEPSGLTEAA